MWVDLMPLRLGLSASLLQSSEVVIRHPRKRDNPRGGLGVWFYGSRQILGASRVMDDRVLRSVALRSPICRRLFGPMELRQVLIALRRPPKREGAQHATGGHHQERHEPTSRCVHATTRVDAYAYCPATES